MKSLGWWMGLALVGSFGCSVEGGPGGGGGEGGEGGEGTACEAFLDEASPASVVFRVVNQTSATIYLPGGPCRSRFSIARPGGEDLHADLTGFDVAWTCEYMQAHGADGPLDCIDDSVFAVAPGATSELAWDGRVTESRTMPRSCAASAEGGDLGCTQRTALEAGASEVHLQYFKTASCNGGKCGEASNGANVTQSFDLTSSSGEPTAVEVVIAE